MNLSEILYYAEETFKISLTRGWLNSFFNHHINEITKSTIYPQEDARLKAPRSYLKEYLDLVENVIGITPAESIYNIDETNLSDWEERKPKMVIIPKELENKRLHYHVNQGISHQTLIVTINASGDAYFPLIITSDPNTEAIFDTTIRKDADLSIRVENSPYVTKAIFTEFITQKFIP